MGDISVSDADMEAESDRGSLEKFWQALIDGKDARATDIYQPEAVLVLPQTGETITGRDAIAARAPLRPGVSLLKVNRIVGHGGLWITECEAQREQQTLLIVSIARMDHGRIVHETRYDAPVALS